MEQQFMVTQDVNMPNITNDSELNREGTGPAGEESESHQEMTEPAMELFPGSSGDLPLKIQQILCTELDMEQEPMATQNASMPNIASDSEHFKEGNESADEESEADGFVLVPRMGHSTGPTEGTTLYSVIQILSLFMSKWNYIYSSELLYTVFSRLYPNPSVKAHTVIAGETFNTHETFIQKLNLQIELCSAESSSVILVFCPVVSRIGTDMEVSMTRVPDNKPVILVFMHHCHNPSHMTNITVQPCRSNIVQVVHCAFNKCKGLLECQENEQAVAEVYPTLLRYVDSQAEVPQSSTGLDIEQQLIAAQDDITHDSKVQSTEPMGERSESHQYKNVTKMEDFDGSSGDLAPEVTESKVRCTYLLMKQQAMATQDINKPNITNDNEHLKGCNEPAGEEREADGWVLVSRMGHSTGSSGVKVHVLVAGETFKSHDTFMQKMKLQIELCSAKDSNVILVFCPVVSRIGTDMEAAMARVTVNKLVILVFMHHCHNPSHMTNITGQPCRRNIVQVVHCAFHETKGLLQCQENDKAVNAVRSALLSEERTELAAEESEFDGWVMLSKSELSTAAPGGTSLSSVIQNLFLLMSKWNFIYPSKILSAVFPCLSAVVSWLYQNPSVKTHTLVAGETFKSHDTFMQKLKLQIERCSAESSSVILLFCPVVSRIGTDMEGAMARVTDNKPVILVFMHHCHKPSHMTNITVQPCRSNIVQVVHCAFHESTGLLECQENEQAVVEVYLKLLRYVDSQAEVPQSSTGSDIEQQLIAAQDDITHDSKVQSTEPMGERSESLQCKNVTEMEDSGGSCGGLAPEILQSNIDHSNMDMEEKPMAAQDGKRPQKRPSGENSVCPSSGVPTNPKKINYASSLKVHVLVAGETFQAHQTFIQKMKLQIEQHSTESSNIILVFCPVVSQIKTDMEAAMARVTENKPVILMFMHRCHDSSHMTNITVQPSRSNIVQVVHCAFHETKGLLECQENEQAVKAVRSTLLRYK